MRTGVRAASGSTSERVADGMQAPASALRRAAIAMVLAGLLGCGAPPNSPVPTAATPSGAVREYLGQIFAHDLASLRVCSQPFPDGYHQLLIGGMFGPVQALPGLDVARTLALIEFDARRLTLFERTSGRGEATVEIGGVLVERFEPREVEALFRAYAAEAGQPIELALLQETLDNVSRGPVELPRRESVRVVREGDVWRVCPPAVIGEPTPGSLHLKSDPQTAPRDLTIRVGDDSPSGWSEVVPKGAPVWITFTTLPDVDQAIWVDDERCDGRFAIEPLAETDLLLHLADQGCRVDVLRAHPEGAGEHRSVPEVDPSAS